MACNTRWVWYMFILLVTHNTFGIDLELAGVVWNLALCVWGGWKGCALVGALAWLGVRTCLPAAARTMDHGSLLAFALWTAQHSLIMVWWPSMFSWDVLIVMWSNGGNHMFPVRYTRPTCTLREPFFINTLHSTLIPTSTTSMTSIIILVHMFACREIHM